jgi:predicted PurR-regulated permease PerM
MFTGIVIAIAMESLITYLEKKTKRRRLAILLSYLFLIGLLLSGVLVMIPFLINQMGDIISVVVHVATSMEETLKSTPLQDIIKKI